MSIIPMDSSDSLSDSSDLISNMENIPGFLFFCPMMLLVLLLTAIGTSFSYSTKQPESSNISPSILLVVRIWSVLLLAISFSSELLGHRMSLPHISLSILFASSGLFADLYIAQTIFHIATTCSWFGLFDMYVRSNPDVDSLFSPGWIIALFIGTAPILRVHMGNNWQIQNFAYMSIGLVLLLSYFWGVEFPSCAYLKSSEICDVMGEAPSRFAGATFGYDYRLVGMGIAIIVHGLNALLLLSFKTSEDHFPIYNVQHEDKGTSSGKFEPVVNASLLSSSAANSKIFPTNANATARGNIATAQSSILTSSKIINHKRTNDNSSSLVSNKSNNTNNFESTATTIKDLKHIINHASSTNQNNSQNKSLSAATATTAMSHHAALPSHTQRIISVPDDCVEITEAEAIRIVEKGLRHFKSKRAF